MIKNDYTIRIEKKEDYKNTENLVREAFWNVYKPGCDEHFVLHCMRNDSAFIPQLSFVMEKENRLMGQIVFAKAAITAADGNHTEVLTFGPVCIHPDFHRLGLGKALIDCALEKAAEYGGAVFIEGDYNFYSKLGFVHAADYGIKYHGLPEGADASFFLCKELKPGFLSQVKGEYSTPQIYFSALENSDTFEEYEKAFPYKEKLVLPGQLG